jgi:RNA polymerase sigma factor (sigma-70 family)
VPPSQGVRATYERLFAEYFPRIRRGLFGRTGDWELAEELTQRVFVRLREQVSAGRVVFAGITCEFAWLWGWARKELAMFRHAARVRGKLATQPEVLREFADQAEEPASELVEARLRAASMILAMPAAERRVLTLHVMEDLPVGDVAAHTGLSVCEVESLLAEGLSRLRTAAGVDAADLDARAETEWEQARIRKLAQLATPAPLTGPSTSAGRCVPRSPMAATPWGVASASSGADRHPRPAGRDGVGRCPDREEGPDRSGP